MLSLTRLSPYMKGNIRLHTLTCNRLITCKYLRNKPTIMLEPTYKHDIYNERSTICEYRNGFRKEDFIREKIVQYKRRENYDDSFHVFDLGDVIAKYETWCELLPRIKPYYAVKCRPYNVILETMTAMGLNFDCASKCEIESVLQLGVEPSRIIFSHTRKRPSTLEYAKDIGVDLMTFDDEYELLKIKRVFPLAKLLLRFSFDDVTASWRLGSKFGCHERDIYGLLKQAKQLCLNVVGVHFHIGSDGKNPEVFADVIGRSRQIFDVAESFGFTPKILDIGGGFPGDDLSTGIFKKYAEVVNCALDNHFPDASKVDVIAEPGTYFMTSAGTVVVCIIGKRRRQDTYGAINYDYFLNDGIYTSFREAVSRPDLYPVRHLKVDTSSPVYSGILYGETCCGTDIVLEDCLLPELDEGDWIYFEGRLQTR